MKPELGTIIARREFFSTESESPIITLEIGTPVASPHAGGEFMCSFRITSPAGEQSQTLYGIDELRALQLALAHAAADLRRLNDPANVGLHWIAGEPGDLGIRIPEY